MFGKRMKKLKFNIFENIFHKKNKKYNYENNLVTKNGESILPTTMYLNDESKTSDKWLKLPMKDALNSSFENVELKNKLNDGWKVDWSKWFDDNNIPQPKKYNEFGNSLNDDSIPLKRKDVVKKSPILFGTSIVFIGIAFGIIFSQFFLSCI
jgi:hypothetical protein